MSENNTNALNKISGPKLKPVLDTKGFIESLLRKSKYIYFFAILMILGTLTKIFLSVPTYRATSNVNVTIEKTKSPFDLYGSGPDTLDIFKKYIKYLKSSEFFVHLAQNLKFRDNVGHLDLMNPKEVSVYKKEFWRNFYISKTGHTVRKESSKIQKDLALLPVDQFAGMLESLTQVETDNSTFISISVTSLDPFTSMVIANVAAELFVDLANERDENEAAQTHRILEKQLKEAAENLKQSELDLIDFRKKNALLNFDPEHKFHAERVNRMEVEIESRKIQREQNNKLLEYYQEQLDRADGTYAKKHVTPIQQLDIRQKIASLRKQQEYMKSLGFNEDHWQVRDINKQLDNLEDQLKRILNPALSGTQSDSITPVDTVAIRQKMEELKQGSKTLVAQEEAYKKQLDHLMGVLTQMPEEEQTLMNYQRRQVLNFELYSIVNKKLQETALQKVSGTSHVSLGNFSGMPGLPPQPSVPLSVLFSGLAGAFLGTLLVLILEFFDSTVKSTQDLEDLDMVPIGEVPTVFEKVGKRTPEKLRLFGPGLLVCKYRPESEESHAFKYLRLNLRNQTNLINQSAQTILVTSPSRQEGKSFVAANLAICNSQFDLSKRTVIIDCDFYNPTLSWYFGEKYSDGLTSLLKMKALLEDVTIRYKLPNLDVIPAGRVIGSPTEQLGDEKFKLLLSYLKTEYSCIIIDAPPALSSVETAILAGLSEAIIMVCNYRKTNKEQILTAYKKITQGYHKRIYCVLNNIPSKKSHTKPSRAFENYELEIGSSNI